MEESEKRENTEKFLDGLITAWELSFGKRLDGNGYYCFNRGRIVNLKKVRILIKELKSEKREMIKKYTKNTAEMRAEISRLRGKISRMK